ncbi:hypothetical protein [Vibrio sp.]|uniref:hypothetical protein n=1 Tax=Vibrio sp. TaxID=678 RepID=UPI003D11916B
MDLLKSARLADDNLMQLHRELVQKKGELANTLEELKNRILMGKEMGYYPSKVVSVQLAEIIELHNNLNRLQEAEDSEFIRHLEEVHIDVGRDV